MNRYTLRKSYVLQCYQKPIDKIKSYIVNKKNWLKLGETMDIEGHYVYNYESGQKWCNLHWKSIYLTDSELELNLINIKSNFRSPPDSIIQLKTSKISLSDTIQVVEKDKNKIKIAQNIIEHEIQHKF